MQCCAYQVVCLLEVFLLVIFHVCWVLYAFHAVCHSGVSLLVIVVSYCGLCVRRGFGLVWVSVLVSFEICCEFLYCLP